MMPVYGNAFDTAVFLCRHAHGKPAGALQELPITMLLEVGAIRGTGWSG